MVNVSTLPFATTGCNQQQLHVGKVFKMKVKVIMHLCNPDVKLDQPCLNGENWGGGHRNKLQPIVCYDRM